MEALENTVSERNSEVVIDPNTNRVEVHVSEAIGNAVSWQLKTAKIGVQVLDLR